MLKDITFVEPLENYKLHLRFEDGVEGVADIAKMVEFTGVFAPLKDQSAFRQVRVNEELGSIEWACGADIDPNILYFQILGKPISNHVNSVKSK